MRVFIEQEDVYPIHSLRRTQHVRQGVEMEKEWVDLIEFIDESFWVVQEWLGNFKEGDELQSDLISVLDEIAKKYAREGRL